MRTLPLVARVLVVSADPVGPTMAGPGIRYLHFARELAKRHEVTVAAPGAADAAGESFEAVPTPRRVARFAARFDVVVAQRLPPSAMHRLARADTRTIYDLYAPSLVEALALLGADGGRAAELRYREVRYAQWLALALGDSFLCASGRQRDLWLGALAALGRLDVEGYRHDPALDRLVAVVPFGLEERRPAASGPALKGVVPGIEEDSRVLLWGGGVWDWLDPLTVIRAVAELGREHPDVRLYFPATVHPASGGRASAMAGRARELAASLGLEGRSVFFGAAWVPYATRDGYLLEADVGVSAHVDTVEARFAFRTRVLDYLWAELPSVLTEGDVLAELVARRGAGLAVGSEDVSGWVEAVDRLLGEPGALASAAESARSLRTEFEWPRVTEPLQRLVANPPPSARRAAPAVLARCYAAGIRASLAGRGIGPTAAAAARRLSGRQGLP
jgi:glycosyltransferase involved in cell wall biosynthesis